MVHGVVTAHRQIEHSTRKARGSRGGDMTTWLCLATMQMCSPGQAVTAVSEVSLRDRFQL